MSLRTWILICLTVTAVGCTLRGEDNNVDRSFSTDAPCAAPCWYNLELERSNTEDVYDTLRNLDFVDTPTIKEYGSNLSWLDIENGAVEIIYQCHYQRGSICGGVVISSDMLTSIWTIVQYDLTLLDVVDKLGPPEHIACTPIPGERMIAYLELYWPEMNIIVESRQKRCSSLDAQIKPDLKVTSIEYSIDRRFEVMNIEECCAPWPGFENP